MKDNKILELQEPTRRAFCAHACQAASLVALGSLLPGCGGGSPTSASGGTAPALTSVTGTSSGGRVSLTVDSSSPLNTVGGAALIRVTGNSYLASRTGTDTFTVLTAVCTHEGCTVEGFRNSQYVCPCHGSTYTTSGTVVTGPATRALTQFSSTFANGVLSFNA
jgi:cytochrome b6-f complex iron-sulfur subunit